MTARTLYPLSLDLSGKQVLVVGAGPVAARKLPELLRCGAVVTVVAPRVAPAVARLASALKVVHREFEPGDLAGSYLVFACTDNPEVNRNIADMCLTLETLCNVADSSEAGSFHVPGVIRQGDVTVTVSSGGTAPGLTRHLKRMLAETLGEEVAELAAVLGRFRAALRSGPEAGEALEIMEHLPYRKLLDDMRQGGAEAVEAYLNALRAGAAPSDAAEIKMKAVTLIGAGPGHPKLLTLLAAEAIGGAEVIVHDRLIPEETLHLAPPDCVLIPAGKRGHAGEGESARQEEIENQLVEQARLGRRVVRLKGGDPFVFGRGWEEVLALEAHGIPWTLIPGLSSITAVPAWAGIPLTHRGVARSFAVMSGMAYSETNTDIPKADTIVLVMGLHRLGEIIPAFAAQGWSLDTPAAAIQDGTSANQRVCRSTLRDIQAETARMGFDSPTLLVIGEVVGLGAKQG
jgi:uroporphyrin-III C-methyltransferase/precorrin-2 dehydrogenase/sirohydrochlorin ferrochelatase